MNDQHGSAPAPAIRLIFEYEGDEVRLVSRQAVDVAVPGFDLAEVPHPGHYVETRDQEGRPLSRVPAREAFTTSAEVFPEEAGGSITRVEVPTPRGAFTVIVPARPEAVRVSLLRITPPPDVAAPRLGGRATTRTPGEPEVTELGSFALDVDSSAGEEPGGH